MPAPLVDFLVHVTKAVEIAGAVALILGFLIATAKYVRDIMKIGPREAYDGYRTALGRVVLIGLEILVAATILKTVTIEPNPEGLGLLAMMIGIRTVLGWSMVLEMDGRWPWQKKRAA